MTAAAQALGRAPKRPAPPSSGWSAIGGPVVRALHPQRAPNPGWPGLAGTQRALELMEMPKPNWTAQARRAARADRLTAPFRPGAAGAAATAGTIRPSTRGYTCRWRWATSHGRCLRCGGCRHPLWRAGRSAGGPAPGRCLAAGLRCARNYLARHGTPQHPLDLLQHNCLTFQRNGRPMPPGALSAMANGTKRACRATAAPTMPPWPANGRWRGTVLP